MGWRIIVAKFAWREARRRVPNYSGRRHRRHFNRSAAEDSASCKITELQRCDRCLNIVHRHVARNVRVTDFRRNHKSNLAAEKFLIMRDGLDDFLAIDPGWQLLAGHIVFLAILAVRPQGLFPKVSG